MEGWKQLINNNTNTNINIGINNLPTLLINFQKITTMNDNEMDVTKKFYKHTYNILKTYFENPRYLDDNKVLNFVNDLLIHMTKTFICSNIESIIKKILYEYVSNSQNISIKDAIDQVNLMIEDINDSLYNIIPRLFVRNSVNIYINKNDEAESPVATVAEILNNLIDLLRASSYIEINDYTINIIKTNIVKYFDTITYKLINNWNVVIENIFLYHINHYRTLECYYLFK
jgi:hypothetical protein